MRLKKEYQTAVIGNFLGKHRFEVFACDPTYYPLIAKDFPHFFEDEVELKDPSEWNDEKDEIQIDEKPKKK